MQVRLHVQVCLYGCVWILQPNLSYIIYIYAVWMHRPGAASAWQCSSIPVGSKAGQPSEPYRTVLHCTLPYRTVLPAGCDGIQIPKTASCVPAHTFLQTCVRRLRQAPNAMRANAGANAVCANAGCEMPQMQCVHRLRQAHTFFTAVCAQAATGSKPQRQPRVFLPIPSCHLSHSATHVGWRCGPAARPQDSARTGSGLPHFLVRVVCVC